MKYGISVTFTVTLFLITNCRPAARSTTDGFAFNDQVYNQAILIGDPGFTPDDEKAFRLDRMEATVKSLPAHFHTATLFRPQSKKVLLDSLRAAAASLDPSSTLLIYITSHGWPDCTYSLAGTTIPLRDILASIHRDFPIKRLILLLDACFSGSAVNDLDDNPQLVGGAPLYEQLLIMAAASRHQLSYNFGDNSTSFFEDAVRNALEQLRPYPDATIRDLILWTRYLAHADPAGRKRNSRQDLVYKALPTKTMLSEYLFRPGHSDETLSDDKIPGNDN